MAMRLIEKFKRSKLIINLSWIFFGSVFRAALSFMLSVIAVRSFSTIDYGKLSYASSITSLFSSISVLGLDVIITKEIADDEKETGNILASGILLRLIASLFSIMILGVYIIVRKSDISTIVVIIIYSFSIVFNVFELFIYWFRYEYKSNIIVILKFVAFLISGITKIMACALNNIIIFAVGNILDTFGFAILVLISYISERGYDLKPSVQRGKRLLKSSIPFIFSSVLVAIYSQTDKIMLEAMIDYESVAMYSVSMTLANIIVVVLGALIEAFRPEILKKRKLDNSKYLNMYKQLYGLIFWISVVYGLFVTSFSKQILLIIYGDKYLEAQNTLSMIVWYSSFSYFGVIHNIYMVAEGIEKWVQILTLAGAITNILLNYIFIPYMGAGGAALASLLTQVVANFVIPLFIPTLRSMALLSVKGIFSINVLLKRIVKK